MMMLSYDYHHFTGTDAVSVIMATNQGIAINPISDFSLSFINDSDDLDTTGQSCEPIHTVCMV